MTVLAVVALIGVAACASGWWRAHRRLAALEARTGQLEREVHGEIVPALARARHEVEDASRAAREARRAAGIEEPPPRLAGEPVTAPMVRAVAFGAGARRAFSRLTAEAMPLARTRRTTVRVVGAAARARTGDKRKRRAG